VRHPSFATAEFVSLLRRHEIALVIADTARKFPYLEDLSTNFVYVRLHGDEQLYESGYSKEAIGAWARRVRAFSAGTELQDGVRIHPERLPDRLEGRDVFVYFDNDIKVHAPFDAQALDRAVRRSPRWSRSSARSRRA
jgi:uncharacterized protein YecE (DUF72 family)